MTKAKWALLLAVLVAGLVTGGWLLLRDTTTPVLAEAVHARFTDEVGSSPGDPGVYRYRTVGFEEIDALSGARHEYPAETFVTISGGECGPVVRWDALDERWIDWEHCGSDMAVTASHTFHQWFGIPDLETEVCAEPRPVVGEVGDTATTVCDADGVIETYETLFMGREVLDVNGVRVDTDHLRRRSSLSGGSSGTATVDVWRTPGTALIVRMEVVRRSVTPSAAGDVTYVEELSLDLQTLRPEGGVAGPASFPADSLGMVIGL